MKITETDKFLIRESFDKSSSVLSRIKQGKLNGKSLELMKTLETAVQNLEVVVLMVNQK